jgi:hypothetical protein
VTRRKQMRPAHQPSLVQRIASWLGTVLVLGAIAFFLLRPSLVPLLYEPQHGDLIFQSLPHSRLVDTIEGVSGSRWSHCGIVLQEGEDWRVLEAIGPVRKISLNDWIGLGRGLGFAAYRLRDSLRDAIPAMVAAAETHLGKPYDAEYEFDRDKIYCSELIHIAYLEATGQRLGQVQKLGELDWRPYPKSILHLARLSEVPLDREMITPVSLTRAPELELVHRGGW